MKKLFPSQAEAHKFFTITHREGHNTLDTSDAGTGKTVVAAALAKSLGHPVVVLCPKQVIPSWERELKEMGVEPHFVLNYEKIRTGRTKWMTKSGKKIMKWMLPMGTMVLVDECHKCLPVGTEVTLVDGSKKPIQQIEVGDMVATPIGGRKVTNTFHSGQKKLLLVISEKSSILSSHEHKIYTNRGWVEARHIKNSDTTFVQRLPHPTKGSKWQECEMQGVLLEIPPSARDQIMRSMREAYNTQAIQIHSACREDNMFSGVLGKKRVEPTTTKGSRQENADYAEGEPNPFSKAVGTNENEQPDGKSQDKRGSYQEGAQNQPRERQLYKKLNWWKWSGVYKSTTKAANTVTKWLGRGILRLAQAQHPRPIMADNAFGYSITEDEVVRRTRWGESQLPQSKGERQEKRRATYSSWLEGSPTEEQRSMCGESSKVLRVVEVDVSLPCYDIEVDEANCFYAEDMLVHNCKGPYTQNAQLVISLINQGFQIHGMSATAAEDPTEMRSLGYMLGLHNLNKAQPPLRSWYSWMKHYGCEQDFWNAWRLVKKSKLKELREAMYGVTTKRLSVDDLPEAFRENRIFVEPIQFKNLAKIKKAYKDLGLTPEILEEYIEHGTVENSEHVIVNIIRARQLAESLKVPDLVEMAEDLMLEGLSVVIFVSFRETVEALCEKLCCDRIEGGQKSDRQQVIDDFTADKTNCIVVNTAAGGTGISLHDVNGDRPRVSLISPQFSAKDHVQVLGRIHRNGMKSDALQKILVASGSVEEAVMASMQRRLDNLKILQNQ